MTPKKALLAVAVLLALASPAVTLVASDPVGVYAVVQKVVMEPDECAPTKVQIWGAFSFADPRTGGYGDVQKGYLYYVVPKGATAAIEQNNGKICNAEWIDLKGVATTSEVVGFGGRRGALGRVRAATEKPDNPDVYPLNMGVIRLRNNQWASQAWYTDLAATLQRAAAGR
jgi:hypothetical protein